MQFVEGPEIEASPPFDDLVVRDAEDVDSAQPEGLAVRRRAEQLTGASAGGMEVLDDEVAFGDVVVGLAAPIGHRGPHHLACLAHALGALGRAGERRVVVDEVGCDVAVDGREVALVKSSWMKLSTRCLLRVSWSVVMVSKGRPARPRRPSQQDGVFASGRGRRH